MKKYQAKWTRIVSAALAAGMLASMAACASEPDPVVDDTSAGESSGEITDVIRNTETTEDSRANTPDSLPDDLNLNGETVRVTYRGTWEEDVVGDMEGEIVESSVYESNLAVMERLNITYSFIKGLDDAYQYQMSYRNAVLADSNDFDIAACVQHTAARHVNDYVYANLANTKYLDFSQPWWNTTYMESTGIGTDTVYFLAGDIAPTMLRWTSCAYFNKTLYENYFGDPTTMYELVNNNEWTYDRLREMCQTVFVDVNSDGATDQDDVLGFATYTVTPMDHFTLTGGVQFSRRNEDGLPEIVLNSDATVSYVEKLYQLLFETTGVYCGDETIQSVPAKKFTEDTALFLFDFFGAAFNAGLREMKSDYGIVPFPKVDENQEKYLSSVHDNVPLYALPANLSFDRIDMMSAVLEAQAAENYRRVFPTMYETALKTRYNRDETNGAQAAAMIDLIHDNATTDFVYVYNYDLSRAGTIMRTLMGAKNKNFSSTWKQLERSLNKSLTNLISLYETVTFE